MQVYIGAFDVDRICAEFLFEVRGVGVADRGFRSGQFVNGVRYHGATGTVLSPAIKLYSNHNDSKRVQPQ